MFIFINQLEDKHIAVAVVVVGGGDDLLARLQPFKHLIELRVLTTDADLAFDSLASILADHIDPLASRLLVECPARDEDRPLRLTELKVQVICLAGPDVVGLLALELEVRLELAVTHLRIDLAHLRVVLLALTLKCASSPGTTRSI